MRVCMILEGCYPYVRGGVSTWVHQYIEHSSEIEFVLWTVHASIEDAQDALYTLPKNVVEHHKVYLSNHIDERNCRRMDENRAEEISSLIYQLLIEEESANKLEEIARRLRKEAVPISLVYSEPFLSMAQKMSDNLSGLGMADAFYSLQSMVIPLCKVLTAKVPQADVYHAAVTGYGGLLGAIAAIETGRPFVLTEHGIYPREREEELISSDWSIPAMRPIWIKLFYKMSVFAYTHAIRVTSLFQNALERQVIIGCDPKKCSVIPNGILVEPFNNISLPDNRNEIHIGAFVRFAAIKDLKTMIRAFYIVRQYRKDVYLHIMGGTDDPSYRNSCMALIDRLGMRGSIIIDGHVNTIEYMSKMDFTLLTSISEGQPLTILESMAAGRACVATRVGNCPGLIEGEMDKSNPAGICCTPMIPEEIASAITKLCNNPEMRKKMGENGKRRVRSKYLLDSMIQSYHTVYQEVI